MRGSLPERPFTVAEAAARGWRRDQLAAGVREGRLRRVIRGVYVDAAATDTTADRAAALARVVSPWSVVCDRTAAWLHGVDVFTATDHERGRPIETCVLRGHSPSVRAGVDGRTRDLSPRDVTRLDGVAVTTPLRTALDLGCALGRHRALGALDGLMRAQGVTRHELERELVRYTGRRGVVQLRMLVPLADPRAESPRESWLRLDLLDHSFPRPELNWGVVEDGVELFRLDLAYPAHRVAIEYDGEEWHRRTPEQRAQDAARRTALRARGWTVVVVDKDSLASGAWAAELWEALTPRTRRLRWAQAET